MSQTPWGSSGGGGGPGKGIKKGEKKKGLFRELSGSRPLLAVVETAVIPSKKKRNKKKPEDPAHYYRDQIRYHMISKEDFVTCDRNEQQRLTRTDYYYYARIFIRVTAAQRRRVHPRRINLIQLM